MEYVIENVSCIISAACIISATQHVERSPSVMEQSRTIAICTLLFFEVNNSDIVFIFTIHHIVPLATFKLQKWLHIIQQVFYTLAAAQKTRMQSRKRLTLFA